MNVSRLCFGSLTIGPLQRSIGIERGAEVIRCALEHGVNFIDTAEMYDTYAHIAAALAGFSDHVYVASKSYAFEAASMDRAVAEARRALGHDISLLFLLHEQESIHTIRGHWPAVEYLLKAKERGDVQAIGVSTHHTAAVEAAAEVPVFDVISPLINRSGVGIQGGGVKRMQQACMKAYRAGKGLYGMKALGGGHLLDQPAQAFDFALQQDWLASTAVGMKSCEEVRWNAAFFSGEQPGPPLDLEDRRLHIESWCTGCSACAAACGQGAVTMQNGRANVDSRKCVFCGYCGAACPEFAIKVI